MATFSEESVRGDRRVRQINKRNLFETIILTKLTTEPSDAEKQEGMIAYADGTSWDPGSGAGIYWWDGSSWNFLG